MLKNEKNDLKFYTSLKKQLEKFKIEDIENNIINYCLNDYKNIKLNFTLNPIYDILIKNNFSSEIEEVINFFEILLDEENKNKNGIVFTPKYISDYINKLAFKNLKDITNELKIIDPSCGSGIFLVSAILYLHKKYKKSIKEIIEKHIYGIDIEKDNVRRCKIILKLLCAKNKEDYNSLKINILCENSLKINWQERFAVKSFSHIVGNPPYVNPHDMNKNTIKFLKDNFLTTKSGTFNIFYAFIEYSMKFLDEKGILGYIIPNNFLTIKSALELRIFLQNNLYLYKIIDFGDNMIFKPKRTYNCIIFLNKKNNEKFKYFVMPKVEKVEESLKMIKFQEKYLCSLDKHSWKLVDIKTQENLKKIESQKTLIKNFIRTGIATLRDEIFLVEYDKNGFYKEIDGKKNYIENDLIKPIYKIPELKTKLNPEETKKYIIFPYVKKDKGYTIIEEMEFAKKFPKTYNYLDKNKSELDKRDNGKKNPQGWYAYGRSQGLNKYGKKLLFPTFSNKPRFLYIENEEALFCNGYAIFENEEFELEILLKILNSNIMDYYIKNSSYAIEGGYYCYQKKYIERFSIPAFSLEEKLFLKEASQEKVNEYLKEKYNLK